LKGPKKKRYFKKIATTSFWGGSDREGTGEKPWLKKGGLVYLNGVWESERTKCHGGGWGGLPLAFNHG